MDYLETEVPDGDQRQQMMETVAEGHPFVLVVADLDAFPEIALKVHIGNGVNDTDGAVSLLWKGLEAMPVPAEERREMASRLLTMANEQEGRVG